MLSLSSPQRGLKQFSRSHSQLTFCRSLRLLESLHCQFWRHPVAVPAPASDVKHVGSTFLAGTVAHRSCKMQKTIQHINKILRKILLSSFPMLNLRDGDRERERVQLHQVTPPQSVLYRASPSHGAVLGLQRKTAVQGEIMHRYAQIVPSILQCKCAIFSFASFDDFCSGIMWDVRSLAVANWRLHPTPLAGIMPLVCRDGCGTTALSSD